MKDSNGKKENKDDKDQVIDIDPDKVTLSKNGGARNSDPFSDIFGGGLFGGGLFSDLFGGLFGGGLFGDADDDDEEYVAYDDFGQPIPIDIFDRDFVEVHDMEFIDDDLAETEDCAEKNTQSNNDGVQKDNQESKGKNPFKKIKDKILGKKAEEDNK